MGLSRTQAERAAARNVNAYGQKEEGPSRWQERKEAKRQMYLMSTEKAVKLGVRKDAKLGGVAAFGGSQQCQKCFQMGRWTYECKNERIYIWRPARTQQLANPKLKPKLMEPEELLVDTRDAMHEATSRKANKEVRKKRKAKPKESSSERDSDSDSDSSDSSSSAESDISSESSDYDRRSRRSFRSRKGMRVIVIVVMLMIERRGARIGRGKERSSWRAINQDSCLCCKGDSDSTFLCRFG